LGTNSVPSKAAHLQNRLPTKVDSASSSVISLCWSRPAQALWWCRTGRLAPGRTSR
jgi:hypothetical protein